jgi:metal-dependent amidase/aminoacylase/carboxypeptidase family protein
VLAFGKIVGLGATNVIPERVEVEGTFRTMNEEWRAKAHEFLKKTAIAVARDMGGDCEFRIENGYPFLVNEPGITDRAREAAEEYLGKENVVELDKRMTAEDFAFYSQKVPACFYRLGTSSPDGKFTAGVHTPVFDIDENALETGMGLMAWIAIDALKN